MFSVPRKPLSTAIQTLTSSPKTVTVFPKPVHSNFQVDHHRSTSRSDDLSGKSSEMVSDWYSSKLQVKLINIDIIPTALIQSLFNLTLFQFLIDVTFYWMLLTSSLQQNLVRDCTQNRRKHKSPVKLCWSPFDLIK